MSKIIHTVFLMPTGQRNGGPIGDDGRADIAQCAARVQHGLAGIESPKITVCYGSGNRESADALFVGLRDHNADCSSQFQEWDVLAGVDTSQVHVGTDLVTLCKDAGIKLLTFVFDLIYDFQATNVFCVVCGEHTLQILSYLLFQDVGVDPCGVFKIQIYDTTTDSFQVKIIYDGDRSWDAEFPVTIPRSPGHLLAHLFKLDMTKVMECYIHTSVDPSIKALRDAKM